MLLNCVRGCLSQGVIDEGPIRARRYGRTGSSMLESAVFMQVGWPMPSLLFLAPSSLAAGIEAQLQLCRSACLYGGLAPQSYSHIRRFRIFPGINAGASIASPRRVIPGIHPTQRRVTRCIRPAARRRFHLHLLLFMRENLRHSGRVTATTHPASAQWGQWKLRRTTFFS